LTRPHLVLVAALGSLVFGWIFTHSFVVLVAGVCAVDWFVVNALNRFSDFDEDAKNRLALHDLELPRRPLTLAQPMAIVGTAIAAGHLVCPELTALRVAAHACGLAYNWPLFPLSRRLKSVYVVKNLASATGFLLTAFGYPLCLAWAGRLPCRPDLGWTGLVLLGVFFFLYELTFELLFDLRDRQGDAAAGVRTIATVHGSRRTGGVVAVLLSVASGLLAAGYLFEWVPLRMLVLVVGPAVTALLWWKSKVAVDERTCVGHCLATCSLLCAYLIWAFLELPGA
jgi:4-hydroxybenzoate polyprenyltransferase